MTMLTVGDVDKGRGSQNWIFPKEDIKKADTMNELEVSVKTKQM